MEWKVVIFPDLGGSRLNADAINEWFGKNKDIDNVRIRQSEGQYNVTITILYKRNPQVSVERKCVIFSNCGGWSDSLINKWLEEHPEIDIFEFTQSEYKFGTTISFFYV